MIHTTHPNPNSCVGVQVATKRCFGARLMLDPDKVRRIVSEMCRQVCHTEVTVKCRIGADDRDSYEELCEFVEVRGAAMRVVNARACPCCRG